MCCLSFLVAEFGESRANGLKTLRCCAPRPVSPFSPFMRDDRQEKQVSSVGLWEIRRLLLVCVRELIMQLWNFQSAFPTGEKKEKKTVLSALCTDKNFQLPPPRRRTDSPFFNNTALTTAINGCVSNATKLIRSKIMLRKLPTTAELDIGGRTLFTSTPNGGGG